MSGIYLHNSSHKEFIREKWVEFAKDLIVDKKDLDIITFPAEEMHDLHLFAKEGLFEWRKTETGSYYITKGRIICFEKIPKYCITLNKNLSNAIIEQTEIGAYLREKYKNIMSGNTKIFPVDIINLDYDGNISKSKVPIQEIIDLIFQYQSLHKKDFSLFITWPSTEAEDEEGYKELLKKVIEENLEDPRAISFKTSFDISHSSIDKLNYENLSIIGLAKIIIQKSSNKKYNLHRNEFYLYGEKNRRRMFSILLNFKYKDTKPEHSLYSEDVIKSLADQVDLSGNNN